VAPTWYPQYSKVVYTLDANALPRAVGEVSRAANAFNSSAEARVGNLAALHVQPLVDTSAAANASPKAKPMKKEQKREKNSPLRAQKKADVHRDGDDDKLDDLEERSQDSFDDKGRPM
jgi:hypothetical protein